MRDPTEIDEFWKDLEEKTGESIIVYSIGETLTPFGTIPSRTVGLFYLTKSRFFFQSDPDTNWFSGLFKGLRKGKDSRKRREYIFPLSRITRTSLDLPEGFFRRIFISPLSIMELDVIADDGAATTLKYTLMSEDKALEFLDVIQKGERE
ncbi:MAG: hypothetical protein ACLFRY_09470 [Spirochaetia bacterium]